MIDDAPAHSPLELLKSFSITEDLKSMKERMLNTVFVLPEIAILGQWTTLYASPNTGKTLLTLWMLCQQVKAGAINGEDVFYINCDDSYNGGVEKAEILKQYGIHALIPGEQGFNKNHLLGIMMSMASQDQAKGKVIVLDTLKKFTNLMNKEESSKFGEQIGYFRSKGGTLIALAHTNKNRDADGKSVHAGTSDVVDDSDCTYIIERINYPVEGEEQNTITVEFRSGKKRGPVCEKKTYTYTQSQNQTYVELFNSIGTPSEDDIQRTKQKAAIEIGLARDADLIDTILQVIHQSASNKTELIDKVYEESGETKRKIRQVLKQWEGKNYLMGHRWHVSKLDKNRQIYHRTHPRGY